jgi:Pam16
LNLFDVDVQRYEHLFNANEKGSFYIQSKVFRAKEALEAQYGTPEAKSLEGDKSGTSSTTDSRQR